MSSVASVTLGRRDGVDGERGVIRFVGGVVWMSFIVDVLCRPTVFPLLITCIWESKLTVFNRRQFTLKEWFTYEERHHNQEEKK